jgi:hypothetical protein
MYQFPLEGGSYELDNQTIYWKLKAFLDLTSWTTVCRKLKAFLIDSLGWDRIEPHDKAENGRNAYFLACRRAKQMHGNCECETRYPPSSKRTEHDERHGENWMQSARHDIELQHDMISCHSTPGISLALEKWHEPAQLAGLPTSQVQLMRHLRRRPATEAGTRPL